MRDLRDALAGLTTRGRCLLAAGVTLSACAVLLGQRDLLRAGLLLLALPLVAVAVVVRTRYRLALDRDVVPSRVPVGRRAEVRLRMENVSRLPTGTMLVEDQLPYVLGSRPRFVLDKVEPRGRRTVTYTVASDVRGRFRVGPLAVRLTDPFGLVELARSFTASDELVVTPVVSPLPPVRLGGDRAGGGEASLSSSAASGSDDVSTREYRHGDDVRRVHWRSTARTGELMVRSEEQPLQSRATLLLDGRLQAHRGEGPGSSYEWAVSAVASTGAALLRSGFAVRLLDHAGRDTAPPGVGLTEAVLLDALAGVTPDRARTLEPAVAALRTSLRGTLVAVLGALEPEDAEQLARLRGGGTTRVAVLLDTDSWAPVSDRARAAARAACDDTAALLAGSGWRVLRVEHGTTLASVWPRAGAGRTPVSAA